MQRLSPLFNQHQLPRIMPWKDVCKPRKKHIVSQHSPWITMGFCYPPLAWTEVKVGTVYAGVIFNITASQQRPVKRSPHGLGSQSISPRHSAPKSSVSQPIWNAEKCQLALNSEHLRSCSTIPITSPWQGLRHQVFEEIPLSRKSSPWCRCAGAALAG